MERCALALSDRPPMELSQTILATIPRLREDDDWDRVSGSEASKEELNGGKDGVSLLNMKKFRGLFSRR